MPYETIAFINRDKFLRRKTQRGETAHKTYIQGSLIYVDVFSTLAIVYFSDKMSSRFEHVLVTG